MRSGGISRCMGVGQSAVDAEMVSRADGTDALGGLLERVKHVQLSPQARVDVAEGVSTMMRPLGGLQGGDWWSVLLLATVPPGGRHGERE